VLVLVDILYTVKVQEGHSSDTTSLQRHFLGSNRYIFSHTRLETVDDRYVSGTSSSPNCPFSSFHCTFCFIRYLWRGSLCLHSSLPACTPHCQTFVIIFRNDGGSNALYPSKQCGKGNLSPDPINACVLDVNSVSLTICNMRLSKKRRRAHD
jgi:hypothetical protein